MIGRLWVRSLSNARCKWFQSHARINSCTQFWFIIEKKLCTKSVTFLQRKTIQRITLRFSKSREGKFKPELTTNLRIATTYPQRPLFWDPSLTFNIKLPLSNDHLSTTPTIFWSWGWYTGFIVSSKLKYPVLPVQSKYLIHPAYIFSI